MKIFHEAPISIFDEVQKRTDGDYALCHLLEENDAYRMCFQLAKEKGREIILDNSAFELDAPVDWGILNKWVQELKPTWFMLPDELNNRPQTVLNAANYITKYGIPKGVKTVGVVQGGSYEEIIKCYEQLKPMSHMLAFSFNYSWWRHPKIPEGPTLSLHKMHQRILMLNRLEQDGIIDTSKPHHLLGCDLPQEFIWERRKWIYSVDTSNPVMWGLLHGHYPNQGPTEKPKGKLYKLIDYKPDADELRAIKHNIGMFRRWCNC